MLVDQFGRQIDVAERRVNTPRIRAFEGANHTRLTADWLASQTSLDYDLRHQLKTLINRSRTFEQSSDLGEGYLKLMERNVLGAHPFTLQMRILEADGKTHDRRAEQSIENAWYEQGKPQNWTLGGRMSRSDYYGVALRSLLRDGGVLARIHRGSAYGKYGYAIEPLDIDFLDPEYHSDLPDGGRIVMSVEVNAAGKVVAYHLLGTHPGEVYTAFRKQRTRVLARDVMHYHLFRRMQQHRGYPEFAAIMNSARELKGYIGAELTAARVSASKMGFLEKTPGEGTGYTGEEAETGGRYMETEPGALEELPVGMTFKSWDPQHPTSQFGTFVKENKRGQASALGVAYTSYANDPGDANFSSMRISLLDEREGFAIVQRFLLEHDVEPVFSDWLFTALGLGRIGDLPASKFEKFNTPIFYPKKWSWLDPKAEADALKFELDYGITSPARVVASRGSEEQEIHEELESSMSRRMQLGLVPTTQLAAIREGRSMLDSEGAIPPLSAALGVGGTQALTTFLQSIGNPENNMSEEAIETTLTIVFGLDSVSAKKLAKKPPRPTATPPAAPQAGT